MQIERIKMGEFLQNGSNIFSGRDKGVEARKAIGLEKFEENCDEIFFLIPDNTWGINPSFYGGLLEGSIKKFVDINEFLQKYHFAYYDGRELKDSLKADLQEGLQYVLNSIEG